MSDFNEHDPMDKWDEEDAPTEIPQEISEDVREMTPSFKVVDKRKYFELINYQPHGRQWLFHESDARFRVPIAGRRAGKTSMAGKDLEPKLLVPNKRIWIVGQCVDEETEILTKRGWLRYDQVTVGDETLSINPTTGLSEWDFVQKIHTTTGTHNVIRMEGYSFSAVTTPDHRWLTNRRKGIGYREDGSKLPKILKDIEHILPRTADGWTWRTSNTLTADDRIPRASLCADIPTEPKYTDEFVELVAWIWTEGSLNGRSGNAYNIHQSHTVNFNNVLRIRNALRKLCPNPIKNHSSDIIYAPYWSENIPKSNKDKTVFYLGTKISEEFQKVFISHKVVDPEFITTLTHSQLKLFVDVSILGDGTRHHGTKNGYATSQTVIYQDNPEQLFAVQLACSLLGIPTSIRPRTKDGNTGWILGILTKNFVNPKRAQYVSGPKGIKITEDSYNGTMWCVTTCNGNWLAKRRGTLYYTSNTYELGEKEFRVVWDDMIVRLGFGHEKKIKKAYNKKMGNMFIEFPWNTRVEVRSADRPDTLVGESLDHVIMSEAARHNQETWQRLIQPALSDKLGSADFPTTPLGMNWIYDLWRLGQDPEYAGIFASWRYPTWENQIVFPGGREDPEIKLLEKTMAKEEFEQEIAALFTSFSGKIYSEWDEELHVKDFGYNPEWKNYIAFDWGFVNPLAAIEFQIDPMDRVWIWREHYKERIILEDHLRMLKNRIQPDRYKIDLCFGDAADQGAIATVSANFAPCWGDPKSKDNWMEGVQLVKSFLKTQQVGEADEFGTPKEEPWLFVNRSCTNTIREFNNYRSSPRRGGRIELSPREAAQKYDDHALDAIRYGLMHIFKLGANVSLSTTVDKHELVDIGHDHGYFTSDLRF